MHFGKAALWEAKILGAPEFIFKVFVKYFLNQDYHILNYQILAKIGWPTADLYQLCSQHHKAALTISTLSGHFWTFFGQTSRFNQLMYRYHEMIINCPQYKTDLVLDTLQAGSPGVASEEVQKGVANEAGPGSTVTCSQIKKRTSRRYGRAQSWNVFYSTAYYYPNLSIS